MKNKKKLVISWLVQVLILCGAYQQKNYCFIYRRYRRTNIEVTYISPPVQVTQKVKGAQYKLYQQTSSDVSRPHLASLKESIPSIQRFFISLSMVLSTNTCKQSRSSNDTYSQR